MTVVKLNSSNFAEIQTHVENAKKYMDELIELWDQEFTNIKSNFVDNEFIDKVYDDNKKAINDLVSSSIVGGSSFGSASVSGTDTGGNVAYGKGLIRSEAIDATNGAFNDAVVSSVLTGEMSYVSTARDALKSLIVECSDGSNACYTSLNDFYTKLNNVSLALQLVLFKVAEFQSAYANLQTTADEMGSDLSLNISTDGILMGINTTVEIDGQKYEITTSEAMNALFTYSNTVMNAEFEAEYLKAEYGYEVNYSDLVKNANAFMAKTIESGLYSNEFILGVLPANMQLPDLNKAYDAVTAATKLSLDELKSVLANNQDIGGDLALYGGLLGAALLGTIGNGTGNIDNGGTPIDTGGTNTGGTYTGGYTGGGYTGGSTSSGGGTTTDDDKKDEEDKDEEDKEQEEKKLEEMSEVEIPEEEIKPDYGEVDYDQLAKDEYEFGTSVEDIIDHRNEIIALAEQSYESGNLTELEAKLKEYGYSEAEIDAILADRFKCCKALLEGDEKAILAEKAIALAAADGVENYESSWNSRPSYDDLSTDGPSELLTLTSTDENIRQLKTDFDTAKENYQKITTETNEMLKEVNTSKAKVQELKEKYEKEYGEDVSKWSTEAVTEYNEAVKTYNEGAEKFTEQLTKLDEAKTTYNDTLDKFNTAKEEYYKKLKEESSDTGDTEGTDGGTTDGVVVPDGTVVTDDSGIGIDGNGTFEGIGSSTNNIAADGMTPVVTNGEADSNNGIRVSENGIGFEN